MTPRPTRTALARGAWYFAFWLVLLPSVKPSDLALGLAVAAAAAWVSLRLLPLSAGRLNIGALLALLPHFAWESVLAGVDVARRALSRRMPLDPGFVACPLGFPPGLARDTFASITSLLPGTVAVGDGDDPLLYHCLDVAQPVVEQLREEERLLARALIVDG
jgi:multicomponent Na+:H+ antiporter subunit E